jgi:hypothetical protein
MRDRLWSELAGAAGYNGPGDATAVYDAAVEMSHWHAVGVARAAWLWLAAAWAAADADDAPTERLYRAHAARALEGALRDADHIPRRHRALVCYYTGELWRRAGDRYRAAAWFDHVEDEVTDRAEQAWLLAAARRDGDAGDSSDHRERAGDQPWYC